jgi:sugar/nucleoside kinase (ribokinase family)
MDFIAIGDTTVDEFIRLKDARVSCDMNDENCTISMKWGDKIPYDFSVLVPGVGNAANAAVAAARLGLTSGFVSNIGKDDYGEKVLAALSQAGVDTRYVASNDGLSTNHHYVLWYESERTILIRHEAFPYRIPADFTAPKWIYLSSVGENSEAFHGELAAWLGEHPETKLAFQPGTYQITMGKDTLKDLYAATEVFASNKQEAERILGLKETDVKELLQKMHSLGPKTVVITDGPRGAYASDGTEMFKAPMYPDPRPVVDRTGAGDATTATFVVALALRKSLPDALLWGPVNAMSVVQEVGAQKGLLSRGALLKLLGTAPPGYRAERL